MTFADVTGVDKVLAHGSHDLDGKKVCFARRYILENLQGYKWRKFYSKFGFWAKAKLGVKLHAECALISLQRNGLLLYSDTRHCQL